MITLDGSKSISNRALVIQALCAESFQIHNLSTSDDTQALQRILANTGDIRDAGHAGTTFRFMTAYLTLQKGTQILTGSDRMKERPIGPLVDALRSMGGNISYLEKEGYPPLEIGEIDQTASSNIVTISGSMSSQYVSALLMIAPRLPKGLEIEIEGTLVSKPYVEMTIALMKYFGVEVKWSSSQVLHIAPQAYVASDLTVESDWSAASYYYAIAALSTDVDITLLGLHEDSLQGDQQIAEIGKKFGIATSYIDGGIQLLKKESTIYPSVIEQDFLTCPDIAQTVAVMVGGLGIDAIFSGLQTLKIKETNRIDALRIELAKVGVSFAKLPSKFSKSSDIEYYMVGGKAKSDDIPTFETYKDHRMAMSFAALSCLFSIKINNPEVINKSYPKLWKDLITLDFSVI